jgi:DNA-binding HxlR family transcriptional regulator
VSGISESVLSQRLCELINAGLASREIIEGPPRRAAYRLTEPGMALRPALQELSRWAGVHRIGCRPLFGMDANQVGGLEQLT